MATQRDATLVLRLAAPMQSWGTYSRFDRRDTGLEPSKSGIIGLLCAALGRPRTEPVVDLTDLRVAVRVDHQGTPGVDFHTVEAVPNTEGRNPKTVVSHRWYLADAVFLVALEGPHPFLEYIDEALRTPRWLLALGRRAFVPTPPLSLGVERKPLEEVVSSYPWLVTSRRIRSGTLRSLRRGERVTLRTVTDSLPEQADAWPSDHPVSFEPRRFLRRPVAHGEVPLTEDLIREEMPWSST